MSGLYNNLDEIGDLTPHTWDTLKNGSRKAILAGHSQATAKFVHEQAIKYSTQFGVSYDYAEQLLLDELGRDDASRLNQNLKLDKYSQPMKPGPEMARNMGHIGNIMKGRHVNKSSKGKHPSNLTPPKKKRK